MSEELFKMNMIASVQKLDNEDIETIQNYIKRIEDENETLKNANEYHQNIIHELETMKQPNQLHSENVKLRADNKRLNNIIKDIKSQLDYLETYSSKEDVFEDMKRRLDRIDKILDKGGVQ